MEQKLSPLTDNIRFKYPEQDFFTHVQTNAQGQTINTRIDHIFAHPDLLPIHKKSSVIFCPFSDHHLLTSHFSWGNDTRQRIRMSDETACHPLLRSIVTEKTDLGKSLHAWDVLKFETFSAAKALEIEKSRERCSTLTASKWTKLNPN